MLDNIAGHNLGWKRNREKISVLPTEPSDQTLHGLQKSQEDTQSEERFHGLQL